MRSPQESLALGQSYEHSQDGPGEFSMGYTHADCKPSAFVLFSEQTHCDRVSPIVGTAPAGQELLRSHVAMGTFSPRGRHSEVASTTSDDEVKADWPAGGQRPGIPQEEEANEEEANEEAANEEEGAAIENGGATSEEKGGGNGRRGEPHNPEDNPEDGGRPAVQELVTTTPGEAEWCRSPRGPESNEGTTIEPATAPEGRGSGRYGPCGQAEGHLKGERAGEGREAG
ncbi:hypothetical protein NDU88_002698 [Pleurodeles waltl]|uniref:Uncharacterized protein n=1 Tax=Pleurodeles waltl TaxID=8319 RepID=A0AAV7TNV2_PLEWA|nr:hypothetical protein NDU88_002698 [Pleurodeles waltl]